MDAQNQVITVENKLNELLTELPGYFLVETSVKPTNNIKVFVDADQGAAIDQLSRINRALYKWVEENLFPNGDFSIEVSSPGLDEPLKLDRQYVKNINRMIEVVLKNGLKKEGKLISVLENEIVIEEEKARPTGSSGRGKGNLPRRQAGRKELIQHSILKEEIKTTKIQIKF